MSTSATPPSSPKPPAPADATPPRAGEGPAEDLDLEEDVAPNLGGEDQMQDA